MNCENYTNFESYINDISNKIFAQLGSGHMENIYQEALVRELNKKFSAVEREKHIPVMYTDTQKIKHTLGYLRIDIFVHDRDNSKVYLLEIKSVKNIGNIEINQVHRYCDMIKKNYNMNVDESYIINFTKPSEKCISNTLTIQKISLFNCSPSNINIKLLCSSCASNICPISSPHS